VVVRSDAAIDLHDQPVDGPAARTLPATTEFGSPVSLLVTDDRSQPGWVQVLVPGRPTGATAWVKAEGVELRPVTTEIRIDLARRTLTFLDAGKVVLTTPVAIGSPDSPTPTGRFSVTDKLQTPNPNGAYGPFAFGLSGRSEVLTEFAGGDGQIGIHGTNDPSSIGNDVSHGCVRDPNDVIERLNELLPLGTPVVVS
jgi:lipoprotein-anchoring transpeptidase ErfK/SrfK